MQYIIVKKGTTEDLQEAVNEKIADGWEPVGGIIQAHIANDKFTPPKEAKTDEGHIYSWPAETPYFIGYAQAMINKYLPSSAVVVEVE